jgi:hypothetical protein
MCEPQRSCIPTLGLHPADGQKALSNHNIYDRNRLSARLSAFQAARHRVLTNRFSRMTGISMLSEPDRDMEKLGGDHKARRDGGDRVAEGRWVFVVPNRRDGGGQRYWVFASSHAPRRSPASRGQVAPVSCAECQVRPLPLRLDAEKFACLLEGCLDPLAGHETLEDRAGSRSR